MLFSHLLQVVAPVVPDVVVAIITSAVSFLLVQGAKEVLGWFNVDLSGLVAGATAVIVTVIVAFLNGLLGQIPAGFVPLVDELLKLLVLLLGALGPFGIYHTYKGLKSGR